jgi:hypothetical protein
MAKKPMQFQIPEKARQEIEEFVKGKDTTLSEFLRQSARINMILQEYAALGYKLILRNENDQTEKEIIMP